MPDSRDRNSNIAVLTPENISEDFKRTSHEDSDILDIDITVPSIIPSTIPMGANLTANGATFRLWAPNATEVSVIIDEGDIVKKLIKNNDDGTWSCYVDGVKAEQYYKFHMIGPEWNSVELERPDVYGRQMLHSAGSSIIKDEKAFQWNDSSFVPPDFEQMVIYEVFIPTFIGKNDGQKYPGNFKSLLTKLDYIKNLGFNVIEILPIHEYAGDSYLGYAPTSFFPVESSYGSEVGQSYDELKVFINTAHEKGLAVMVDVVFNHFTDRTGADNFILNYDGDTCSGKGGIYLSGYMTPWGPAPNWERDEVVNYVEDTCRYYLSELHFDGLRWDATSEIINKPNGWNALRDILWRLQTTQGYEKKLFIAEQLPYKKDIIEKANFDGCWFVQFHHSVEKELGGYPFRGDSIEFGINGGDYSKIYNRIVYALGHDEARNGSSYLPTQFNDNEGRNSWDSRAKCRLISSLQFFIPGIPMVFMGEEFLQDSHFEDNFDKAINWSYQMDTWGLQMQTMFKDAIQIRKDYTAFQYGYLEWVHLKDSNRITAFIRKDNVNGQILLVVINLSENSWSNHEYGIHTTFIHGQWRQIFCSQDSCYGGWEWSSNAFYEPWTQADGKVYLNVPKYSVTVMELK